MSSLIEQAAKRLAQLRQAGAEIAGPVAGQGEEKESTIVRVEPFLAAEPERPKAAMVEAAETLFREGTGTDGPSPVQALGEQRSRRVQIDLARLAAVGMITPHDPSSQIAQQYRVIKRPLLANAAGKGRVAPVTNGNLIMVTSALPREGKTFTALNLAMSIASEMDHTVMLVDADVASPSVLDVLGLPPGPGLLDLLQDNSIGLPDTLLRTNVEKLAILPSGSPHPRATELLASDAMVNLLNDMAHRYTDRIIVFDSPPLLVTTEARVLASHMGQIVVVVEAEKTLQSDVAQALATIESCPIRLTVLNKAQAEFKSGYSYGRGYAYGYG